MKHVNQEKRSWHYRTSNPNLKCESSVKQTETEIVELRKQIGNNLTVEIDVIRKTKLQFDNSALSSHGFLVVSSVVLVVFFGALHRRFIVVKRHSKFSGARPHHPYPGQGPANA